MNFHSCQTEGLPGEWSPRDLVLTFRTPPSPPPSSCSTSSSLDPLHLPPLPQPHLPDQSSVVWKQSPTISIFIFQPRTKQGRARPGDPGVHWSERDRLCLLKRSLSIAAWRLRIGTNEAYHSLILIPFDLTHFIDSPCAPNEMLNLSPVAAVPSSYCYGDREREGERERRRNTTTRKVFN